MNFDFNELRHCLLKNIEFGIKQIEKNPYDLTNYDFVKKEIFHCLDLLKELDMLEKRLIVEL